MSTSRFLHQLIQPFKKISRAKVFAAISANLRKEKKETGINEKGLMQTNDNLKKALLTPFAN